MTSRTKSTGVTRDTRIEIRCTQKTKTEFKKIAAEFDDYEHTLMWIISNFEDFRALRAIPPRDQLLIERGVIV